ncbi:hypothetical protein J2793_007440 [Paraburkholderia caledonica]|uniref:Uncharacterized protein n=1 Tax=Paraburkholderia caledonica TaxID=134536 RepID=A0AB73IPY4_9BURK|nr:hypothetical protein [Paraburkholderia caledonica]
MKLIEQRSRVLLPIRATFVGWFAPDRFFDPVERANALEGFGVQRIRTRCVQFVELSSGVCEQVFAIVLLHGICTPLATSADRLRRWHECTEFLAVVLDSDEWEDGAKHLASVPRLQDPRGSRPSARESGFLDAPIKMILLIRLRPH